MTDASDKWLALGIVGLYLYDCLRLTPPDCFYMNYSRGRWGFVFPGRMFRIGRDVLTVFNPLTPWRFEWRAGLRAPRDAVDDPVDDRLAASLDGMRFWVIPYALAALVLLPVSFFLYGVGSHSFVLLIVSYSLLLNLGFRIWRFREAFGLTGKQTVSLLAECVLCPPFAANAVRKIGALKPEIADSIAFAERFLAPGVLGRWRAEALNYVHERQQWHDPDDAAYQEWDKVSNRLRGMGE